MGYNKQSQIFVSMNDPVEDLFGLFITKIIYQSYFLFGFGFLGKCWEIILQRSLLFMSHQHKLSFGPNYIFKYVYIANSLGR